MAVTGGIAAVVAAGTAVYGAVNANQQAQHAKGAAQAAAAGAKVETDAQNQAIADATSVTKANAARDVAEQRQKQIIGSSAGKGSTILTSGLGTIGSPPTASKTLLGA